MAMINRFGIKQPDGTFQYHDLGAKAENVHLDQQSLVDVVKDITKQIDLKFNSAGGIVTGEITPEGGLTYAGKPGYISFPDGGKLRTFSDTAGQLKIILPYSWDNTLIKFKVSIANYKANSSVDYYIAGYMNSANQLWEQCTAVSIGKYNEALSNLTVRFGSNGSNCIVAIGETGTVWNFISIAISDVIVSKIDGDDDFLKWTKDWSILINANNDVTFSQTIVKPHVAEDISSVANNATSNALVEAKSYTDQKVADLIDSAPETLNTLKEIADEIGENQSAIDAINTLVATKADKTDLSSHVNNTTIHITAEERTKWNAKQDTITIDDQLSSTSTNPVQNKVIYVNLNTKVDKVIGKALSTNDFTDAYKNKLDNIEANANNYTQPDSGVTAGSYRKVTVNSKGIVTTGDNSTLTIAEGGTGATDAATALQNFGLTATAAELNILDGITATTDELNYIDGVTSNIQIQLDAKAGLSTATQTADGLFSAVDKKKLDGITAGANDYTHPTYTTRTSGLYKIVVDGLGHVSDVTTVTKDDITALGIPASDTTYTKLSQFTNDSGYITSSGSITGSSGSCTGNAATSTVSAKLGRNGDVSVPMTFNWSGQGGQPSWLWGGSDGTNMYVYDPSNFSVNYAKSSGYVASMGYYKFDSSTLPNSFSHGISCGFVNSNSGFGSYGSVMTVRTYSGGGGSFQIYAPYSNSYGGSHLKARFGNYESNSGNSWTTLKTIAWTEDIPTNTNQLTNGAGFITSSGSITGNAATATTLSSTLAIGKGGTGSTTAAGAHQNLLPNHFTSPAFIDCMGSSGHTGGGGYCTLAELKSALGSMTPASHNQAASTITAGTFAGAVVAPASTAYTTNQIRNGVLITTDPGAGVSSSYANGSIIYVYE